MKVLVADDDESTRTLLKRIILIHDTSAIVVLANSGSEAVACYDAEDFDLIISDFDMSPGMNGIQFLNHVRSFESGLPFILVTGSPDISLPRSAATYDVTHYVRKPFSPEDIRVVLRNVS